MVASSPPSSSKLKASQSSSCSNTLRVVMVGDSGTGKTSLVNYFVSNKNATMPHVSTVGIDFMKKEYDYQGQKVGIQWWDTAGQERFRSPVLTMTRNSNAVVVVVDVTSQLENNGFKVDIASKLEDKDGPLYFIVVNKIDKIANSGQKERFIKRLREINSIPLNYKIHYTSAHTGEGTNSLVKDILHQCMTICDSKKSKKSERIPKINAERSPTQKPKKFCLF